MMMPPVFIDADAMKGDVKRPAMVIVSQRFEEEGVSHTYHGASATARSVARKA